MANQDEANRDIPKLLATPAGIRFLSMEPLLGPVDLNRIENLDGLHASALTRQFDGSYYEFSKAIDWVIVGGESGPDARPMSPHWARDLRDQCVSAEVPFFFEQRGEWGWWQGGYFGPGKFETTFPRDETAPFMPWMTRTGKKSPVGGSTVENGTSYRTVLTTIAKPHDPRRVQRGRRDDIRHGLTDQAGP